MRQYSADNLIVHPGNAADPAVVVEVTPERAGWETISFRCAGSRPDNTGSGRPVSMSWRW